MNDEQDLLTTLAAHERRIWDALVEGDAATDAALLARDFLGVYPDGFADKAQHLGQLDEGPSIASYGLTETRLMRLGPDHAVLSYKAAFERASGGSERMYVSSIWRRDGDGWINVFSQDTDAHG